MKPMPNLMETELEVFGAVDRRGVHLEAALRHRRLHDLRAVHVGVSGPRHREAARPPRDRAEGRRGDGRDRRSRGVTARRRRPRHHDRRQLDVRAHHVRGAVGVHVVQGVRRDLPGEHRDPRQDPRHAALPLADGERLPGRARQHVSLDGELVERLRHEPGRPRRLGGEPRRRHRDRRLRSVRPRVPDVGWLRRLVRRSQQEDDACAREAPAARQPRLRRPRPERAVHR